MKLNQLIAVVNGKKSRHEKAKTAIYHKLQRTEAMKGISRTYQPDDDEHGERFPAEHKRVQYTVADCLEELEGDMTDLFDLVCTQDLANQMARADVVVDGVAVVESVPVTTLLFLEKQLTDLRTELMKTPTLDPGEEWTEDEATNAWRSETTETIKTKKVPRNHEKAPATKEHPAQVEMYYEDVLVGRWRTTKFSGEMPEKERKEMLRRVAELQDAVKKAREQANMIDVTERKIGKAIFEYVFGNTQ